MGSSCRLSHQERRAKEFGHILDLGPDFPPAWLCDLNSTSSFRFPRECQRPRFGQSFKENDPQTRCPMENVTHPGVPWRSTLLSLLCSPSIWPLDYPSIALPNFLSFFIPSYPPSDGIFYLVQNPDILGNQLYYSKWLIVQCQELISNDRISWFINTKTLRYWVN
jgi:hypothetical protein